MIASRDAAASEPFELLANEIRLGIVRELGEAMAGKTHTPRTFSELQQAVGVEDNGKFNYHLDRLVDRFVERVPEGYRLLPAGINVFQAVLSGAYDTSIDVDPTPIDDPCTTCGAYVSVWYRDGRFYCGCQECDEIGIAYPLPPGTFDPSDPPSLADAASTRLSRDYRSFLRGVCPYCSGSVDADLTQKTPEGLTGTLTMQRSFYGEYACRSCFWFMKFTLEAALSEHPAVVSFLYERGLNLFDIRQWKIPYEFEVVRRSEDPLRLATTFQYEGDTRTLVVDDTLRVVAVED